uniref:Uncharacterized protein n=1 Tax=Anas platyrhynchos TaxID=8839 RepID=A0A8B9SIX3_ANAPL
APPLSGAGPVKCVWFIVLRAFPFAAGDLSGFALRVTFAVLAGFQQLLVGMARQPLQVVRVDFVSVVMAPPFFLKVVDEQPVAEVRAEEEGWMRGVEHPVGSHPRSQSGCVRVPEETLHFIICLLPYRKAVKRHTYKTLERNGVNFQQLLE